MKHLQNAEILFWKISVGLMKNRRVFVISLFASLLFVLLLTLLTVNAVMSANQPEGSEIDHSFENQPGMGGSASSGLISNQGLEQQNLLIILVDSLAAEKPEVRGVWLAGRIVAIPQIVFLPLYPSLSQTEQEAYTAAFSLNEDGQLSDQFQIFLRSKEIWWDHFILMDEPALADLVALTDGVLWNGVQVSGSGAVAEILAAGASPESVLKAQALIANEICHSAQRLVVNADPMILWGLLTHRMRSDFQLETVKAAQIEFSQPGGKPLCEFPTITEFTFGSDAGD